MPFKTIPAVKATRKVTKTIAQTVEVDEEYVKEPEREVEVGPGYVAIYKLRGLSRSVAKWARNNGPEDMNEMHEALHPRLLSEGFGDLSYAFRKWLWVPAGVEVQKVIDMLNELEKTS